MQRVLVIGGRGFLGQRVVAALSSRPGVEVVAGTRHGGNDVTVDLSDPATFSVMERFDIVVDCADSLSASPDAALAWCLAHGPTFIEATADPLTLERLLRQGSSRSGLAILGVGLFPGLSNLLARSVWQRAGEQGHLELGVRISPLSGAGAATRRLMTALLDTPALTYRAGQPLELAPLTPGPRLPFPGRDRATTAVRLAEPAMLRASTGASDVAAYLAAFPGFLAPVVRLLAGGRRRRALLRPFMRAGLAVVRGGLLRWRRGRIELTAAAGDQHAGLVTRDGFAATASAIAAAVDLLAAHRPQRAGVVTPDQLFDLDETLARMRAIDPSSAPLIG
jgi:hypothetical protein